MLDSGKCLLLASHCTFTSSGCLRRMQGFEIMKSDFQTTLQYIESIFHHPTLNVWVDRSDLSWKYNISDSLCVFLCLSPSILTYSAHTLLAVCHHWSISNLPRKLPYTLKNLTLPPQTLSVAKSSTARGGAYANLPSARGGTSCQPSISIVGISFCLEPVQAMCMLSQLCGYFVMFYDVSANTEMPSWIRLLALLYGTILVRVL